MVVFILSASSRACARRTRRGAQVRTGLGRVIQRFRQSVLAAAFRGDLTADWRAKHPDVEPASELLKRIRVERRRRWEEAEVAKMQAKGKAPGDDRWKQRYEEPAPVDAGELPEGWSWARWGELSGWITYGFTRPMPHVAEGPHIITAKNVVNGTITLDGAHRTTTAAFDDLSDKDRPEAGDLLITKDGTIGRAAVVPDGLKFCINQSVAVVWLRGSPMNRTYLLRAVEAPFTQQAVLEQARGMAIQHLSVTDFAQLPLPIPPLAEQAAIVETLGSALLRIATLERLVHDSYGASADLDRAILAKAFRGELVPQDPSDEPASTLLQRLRSESDHPAPAATNGHSKPRTVAKPRRP